MARRKAHLSMWPSSFGRFRRFDEREWDQLEGAIGKEIPEDMLEALEHEFFWWLSAFRDVDDLGFGEQERKTVKRVERHAEKLPGCLQELGLAGKMFLEDVSDKLNVRRTTLLSCVEEISKAGEYFDEHTGPPMDPGFAQVHSLVKVFDQFLIPTSTATTRREAHSRRALS